MWYLFIFLWVALVVTKNAWGTRFMVKSMYLITGRNSEGSFEGYPSEETKMEAGYKGDFYGGVTHILSELRDLYRLCDHCRSRRVAYLTTYRRENHTHTDALCVECCLVFYGVKK